MRILNLDDLKKGQPGISPTVAKFIVEATIVCLNLNGHESGVVLKVSGAFNESFCLKWTDKIDSQIIRSWKDLKETAEYGATAIAVLLLTLLTDFITKEREHQHGKGDYYLRTLKEDKALAFLEISGVFKETPSNTLTTRVNWKMKKMTRKFSANDTFKIFTIVTEFGTPKSKILTND